MSSFRTLSWIAAVSLAVGLGACSSEPEAEEDPASEDELVLSTLADDPIAVPPVGTVLTQLAQPKLVAALEAAGLALPVHLGASGRSTTNDKLLGLPLYKFIADDVAADLDLARQRDPKLSTQVANGVTRILDKGWMRAPYASFELMSVVPRFDRLPLVGEGSCGEVRFLYRLAYTHQKKDPTDISYSRLPVVLNVVYDVPRATAGVGECAKAAAAWRVPAGVTEESAYVSYLAKDLLAVSKLRFRQLELNAQLMRVPSETKTDMGGAAEYALRIYGLREGTPGLFPLENTPDVARIEADAPLKAELATYLREHVQEIDTGTLKLPEKFLATKASAFSTFGSARLANKPFTRLFWDAQQKVAPALTEASLANTRYVGNLAGLVARLDDMTCQGCHQGGRGVAGFHALGEDSLARSHVLNVSRLGNSPHLQAELARRAGVMKELATGAEPSSFRPASFAAADGRAPRGAPCLMESSVSAFKTPMGCAAGLQCTSLAANARLPIQLGQCLPALAGAGKRATYAHEFAGLPCLAGTVTDNVANPMHDALQTSTFACRDATGEAGYACRPASIGVPGGLCTRLCASGNTPFDKDNELCAYAGGKEFDECAGKNDFSTCLAGAIKAGLREACDESAPCREDYICQRFIKARKTPPEAPASGKGYCVPTYFLFQVRADGHPNPTPVR
ncbi:MAG: hypothetical protein IPG50_19540 [Myxococcales bacterium]|nr:hypothetical protein [Myxococcales bacterium]